MHQPQPSAAQSPAHGSSSKRSLFARLYRDWCLVGALACIVAGFPNTPVGPLLLWAVVLPGLAGWLLWERPRSVDRRGRSELSRYIAERSIPRQARRRRIAAGSGRARAA